MKNHVEKSSRVLWMAIILAWLIALVGWCKPSPKPEKTWSFKDGEVVRISQFYKAPFCQGVETHVYIVTGNQTIKKHGSLNTHRMSRAWEGITTREEVVYLNDPQKVKRLGLMSYYHHDCTGNTGEDQYRMGNTDIPSEKGRESER
jgi:hypothetical protein